MEKQDVYFYLSMADMVICDEDGNTMKFNTYEEAENYLEASDCFSNFKVDICKRSSSFN